MRPSGRSAHNRPAALTSVLNQHCVHVVHNPASHCHTSPLWHILILFLLCNSTQEVSLHKQFGVLGWWSLVSPSIAPCRQKVKVLPASSLACTVLMFMLHNAFRCSAITCWNLSTCAWRSSHVGEFGTALVYDNATHIGRTHSDSAYPGWDAAVKAQGKGTWGSVMPGSKKLMSSIT